MNEPHRQYELTFEHRPGYLYGRVSADTIDTEMALLYLREVADKCAALNCRRLVIERDIPAMLPAGDMFFITGQFLEMIGDVRVAVLNPHPEIDTDMDFVMTIGNNRGAALAAVNNITDAEKWLLK